MNDNERFQPPSQEPGQDDMPTMVNQPASDVPLASGDVPTHSIEPHSPGVPVVDGDVHKTHVLPTSSNGQDTSVSPDVPAGVPASPAAPAQEFPWTAWEEKRNAQAGENSAPAVVTKTKERRRPGWVALIAASLAAALAGGGIGVGAANMMMDSPRPAVTPTATGGTTSIVNSVASAPDWQAVADEVGASVVAIDVASNDGQSQGSGVIIDANGYILTNEHVVAGANDLFVKLSDSRVFEASVIGEDAATDLAVIQIKNAPDDLTVAQLGESSNLAVGQPVAAIGNPMGLASTLTTGVISALDRPTQPSQGTGAITNAIQLDAAINPGNSGGPVFDANGTVVGIASSIISVANQSGTAGSIGLGFAIPIDLAKNISAQLIENGVAEHAYLGVTISNGLAEYGGTRRQGAEVQTVQAGTPAAEAGIQVGDVIIDIDGKSVPTSISLTGYVRQYRTGDVVTLTIERGGDLINVDATLATRPD